MLDQPSASGNFHRSTSASPPVAETESETETFVRLTDRSERYYLSPVQQLPRSCVDQLKEGPGEDEHVPATVISWDGESFTQDDLCRIAERFSREDDIWTRDFLCVIVLIAAKKPTIDVNTEQHVVFIVCPKLGAIPQGPYFVHSTTGVVSAISKLFPDTTGSFIGGGITHDGRGKYRHISSGDIAVPPRLYYTASASKPLAGLRFAVKDIIDISGLKTGCGNKAFHSTYPPKEKTAPAVQRLLDAGAVCVGKLKTSQFAEGQSPPEWVDYQAPFNPRGDGYQSPSSSSSGSAAAAAAYPWLDFTIGTNTGGSMFVSAFLSLPPFPFTSLFSNGEGSRHPAGVNGIYGIRPSLHAASTEGVFSVTPLMDTVGFFARDAATASRVGQALISPQFKLSPVLKTPKFKLLYPTRPAGAKKDLFRWFPYAGEPGEAVAAENLMETIIQGLEHHLSCTRHAFNIDGLWSRTKPPGEPESLDKAVGTLYSIITTYTPVSPPSGVIYKFLSDFAAANKGKQPFIDPTVKAKFEFGREQTPRAVEEAVRSMGVFGKWVDDVLFKTEEGGEVPVLVFPQRRDDTADTSLHHRENPVGAAHTTAIPARRKPKSHLQTKLTEKGHTNSLPLSPRRENRGTLFWSTFSIYSLSYISGCPDYTVPIGEVPYFSRVTGKDEYLPVSLSFLTRKGYDGVLFEILRGMEEKGVLRAVGTGRRLFGGECE